MLQLLNHLFFDFALLDEQQDCLIEHHGHGPAFAPAEYPQSAVQPLIEFYGDGGHGRNVTTLGEKSNSTLVLFEVQNFLAESFSRYLAVLFFDFDTDSAAAQVFSGS